MDRELLMYFNELNMDGGKKKKCKKKSKKKSRTKSRTKSRKKSRTKRKNIKRVRFNNRPSIINSYSNIDPYFYNTLNQGPMVNVDNINRANTATTYGNISAMSGDNNYREHGLAAAQAARNAANPTYGYGNLMENTNISRGAESAAMAAANAKTRQYEAYLENVANPIP